MAAVLKKRALAEYSQVLHQEEAGRSDHIKRLRLVKKSTENVVQEVDSVEATLIQMENLYSSSVTYSESAIKFLMEQLMLCVQAQSQSVTTVMKIVNLLSKYGKIPGINSYQLLQDMLSVVHIFKNNEIQRELLNVLCEISTTLRFDMKLHNGIVQCAIKLLSEPCYYIRLECLKVIAAIGSPSFSTPNGEPLESILASYVCDVDARVRCVALDSLVTWHYRGLSLPSIIYSQVCLCLRDAYEGVRLAAVKLLWVFSQIYPERSIEDFCGQVRLVDNAFMHICDMLNDLSVNVRAEAAKLLGSFCNVGQLLLDQTLDKKLMSNSKVKRETTVQIRPRIRLGQVGKWSTGRNFGDDAPKKEKENSDEEIRTIMSSGAAGAFVHGLEDEYMEVRGASIDSMCELALYSISFAQLSIDFLVDMFNDEIESVRENAIYSLRAIAHLVCVRDDQLEIILGVLKDSATKIREGLHELFCCIRLMSRSCLYSLVLDLIGNLKLYPADRLSVWRCMQHLGRNHPALVLAMVPDLLSCHPYFETAEVDLQDVAYISVLVLVFNAAASMPTMSVLYPDHISHHYLYLRDSWPNFVPHLEFLDETPLPQTTVALTKSLFNRTSILQYLQTTSTNLFLANNSDNVLELLSVLSNDCEKFIHLDDRMTATANFMTTYIRAQLTITQLLRTDVWQCGPPFARNAGKLVAAACSQVNEQIEKLQRLYCGLRISDEIDLKQLQLYADSLQLLLSLTNKDKQIYSSAFLLSLSLLSKQLNSHNINVDETTKKILCVRAALESGDDQAVCDCIKLALQNHCPRLMSLSGLVRQANATVLEPVANDFDRPIRFTAGLSTELLLCARIEHVENTNQIYIQVKYPDGVTHHQLPSTSDFYQLGHNSHRLQTKLVLSHSMWTDPCTIQVNVMLSGSASTSVSKVSSNGQLLPLCEPIRIYVQPKPWRK